MKVECREMVKGEGRGLLKVKDNEMVKVENNEVVKVEDREVVNVEDNEMVRAVAELQSRLLGNQVEQAKLSARLQKIQVGCFVNIWP